MLAADESAQDEAQQRVEDYVGLCERLITCCESVTLNPIKTGVQT